MKGSWKKPRNRGDIKLVMFFLFQVNLLPESNLLVFTIV